MKSFCSFFDNGYFVVLGGILMYLVICHNINSTNHLVYGIIFYVRSNNGLCHILFASIKWISSARIAISSHTDLDNINGNISSHWSQANICNFCLSVRKNSCSIYSQYHSTAAFGTIITLVCFFSSSLVTSAVAFIVLFGAGHGIGNGLSFLVPVTAGWQYFPTRKGVISGVTMCAFGLGSFIFSLIITHIINPDNLKATIV